MSHPRTPVIFMAYVCAMVIMMITGAVIYSVGGLVVYIPDWLGAAGPAVVTHEALASYRDKDQGAFTLSIEKVALGDPLGPEFHAQGRNGAFSGILNLSVHRCRPDNSRIEGPLPNHHVGERWQTRYCFDMPGTLATSDEFTITGHHVHHRWFGPIREAVPQFTMCPVGFVLVKGTAGDNALDRCEPPAR